MPDHWPLARGKVGYVGQAVAVVLGADKYGVVDAAAHVFVDYEPLPVVVDPEAALEDGSPVIHEEFGTNKVFEWSMAGGDVEGAFRDADVIVEKRIVNHRTAGAAIEPRSVLADWRDGKLTLFSSTQIPHICRVILSTSSGSARRRSASSRPRSAAASAPSCRSTARRRWPAGCARKLGRPVKWTATRSEEMLASHHGRDQIDYVRIGVKRDGKVTGIHARIIQDCGAYHLIEGAGHSRRSAPAWSAAATTSRRSRPTSSGCSRTSSRPTRSAAPAAPRPRTSSSSTMDALAEELGMDALELRRRNFITEFPNERRTG